MLLWLVSREEKDDPINVNGGDDKSRPSVKSNDAFPVLTLWLLSTGDLQWGEMWRLAGIGRQGRRAAFSSSFHVTE